MQESIILIGTSPNNVAGVPKMRWTEGHQRRSICEQSNEQQLNPDLKVQGFCPIHSTE